MAGLERDGVDDAARDVGTVAQQEEQQVHHHAETDHELEGVLADAERARGDELAGTGGAGGQLLLQAADVGQSSRSSSLPSEGGSA